VKSPAISSKRGKEDSVVLHIPGQTLYKKNKEIGKQEIKIKGRKGKRRRRRSFFGGLLALAGLF
jgi:hypothetical protein